MRHPYHRIVVHCSSSPDSCRRTSPRPPDSVSSSTAAGPPARSGRSPPAPRSPRPSPTTPPPSPSSPACRSRPASTSATRRSTTAAATGTFSAQHIIDFPPALYLTWKAKENPIAFGLGIDAPYWYKVDWFPALFPDRFQQRRVRADGSSRSTRWSPGTWGGLERRRRPALRLRQPRAGGQPARDGRLRQWPGPVTPVTVEFERNAEADVDGFSWDAAVHYAGAELGLGRRLPQRHGAQGERRRAVQVPRRAHAAGSKIPSMRSSRRAAAGSRSRSPASCGPASGWRPTPSCGSSSTPPGRAGRASTDTSLTTTVFAGSEATRTVQRDWKDTYSLRLGWRATSPMPSRSTAASPASRLPFRRARCRARLPARRRHGLRPGSELQLPLDLVRPRLLAPRPRQPADRIVEPLDPGVRGTYSAPRQGLGLLGALGRF